MKNQSTDLDFQGQSSIIRPLIGYYDPTEDGELGYYNGNLKFQAGSVNQIIITDQNISSYRLTLTNGSGTTANSSSINLGGSLTSDAQITGSYDFGVTVDRITFDTNSAKSGYVDIVDDQVSFGVSTLANSQIFVSEDSLDLSHHQSANFGIDAITSVFVSAKDLTAFGEGTQDTFVGGGEVITAVNTTNYLQASNENKNPLLLSSRNSLVNTNIVNSVAIGGQDIHVTENNTVFLPKIRIGQGVNGSIPTTGATSVLGVNAEGEIVTANNGLKFEVLTSQSLTGSGTTDTFAFPVSITTLLAVKIYDTSVADNEEEIQGIQINIDTANNEVDLTSSVAYTNTIKIIFIGI